MARRRYSRSSGTARFNVGDQVVDDWSPCLFHEGYYSKLSVGTILEVEHQELNSGWSYRVSWTHGPRAGTFSTMKKLLSLKDQLNRRQEILNRWVIAFERFTRDTNKEFS